MTYEKWRRRPVYMVQCFTFKVYREHVGSRFRLRVFPAFRSVKDQTERDVTAMLVRELRLAGTDRHAVRRLHETTISNPTGFAQRVDIDQELARFHGG